MNSVILLMGPTASGKTALAVEAYQHLPVELISVDSALVYRDMNIGTAKPDADTLRQAPHALIDILSPEESYSAARFVNDATAQIEAAHARGRIPLLVGGTMLYFKALREGLAELPQANEPIRRDIEQRAQAQGWPALHHWLAELDPVTAARLKPNDSQRIERALEVCLASGEAMSALLARQASLAPAYDFTAISLEPSERAGLHQRIEQRFRTMLAQGLVAEVEYLRAHYALSLEMPSMRCVGYRQTWEYLDGAYDLHELENRGIFATRQLAKRQLTWLRSMPDCQRFDCLASHTPQAVLDLLRHTVTQALG